MRKHRQFDPGFKTRIRQAADAHGLIDPRVNELTWRDIRPDKLISPGFHEMHAQFHEECIRGLHRLAGLDFNIHIPGALRPRSEPWKSEKQIRQEHLSATQQIYHQRPISPSEIVQHFRNKITWEFMRDLWYEKRLKSYRDAKLKSHQIEEYVHRDKDTALDLFKYEFPFLDQCIGSGGFGRVYSIIGRPDLVAKIRMCEPRSHVLDDGWITWAKFAQMYQHPNLPQIHDMFLCQFFYVAVCDRYKQTMGDAISYDMSDNLHTKWRAFRHGCKGELKSSDATWDKLYDEYYERGAHIRKVSRDLGFHEPFQDMHDGNAMLTHQGEIVLIDPWPYSDVEKVQQMFGLTVMCDYA